MEAKMFESEYESGNSPTIKKEMTAQEVSQLLRISLSTLHHLSRTGKINALKVGKEWRYQGSDIERRLKDCFYHDNIGEVDDPHSDRRIFPRINCFIQGRLSVPVFSHSITGWEGAVLNLSVGGLLFEVYKTSTVLSLHPNDPAKVTLVLLASNREALELEGLITRLQEAGKTRLGIKFTNPAPQVEQAVHHFIQQAS